MSTPTLHWNQTRFLLSVANLPQLPADIGAEVVFAGRSNAGKSSALNTITGIRGLARTSKTPGCTQLINVFQIDEHHRLMDLPGYGYSKVANSVRERWQKLLVEYLNNRQSLKGFVIVMDIRHPLTPYDQQMLDWAVQLNLPTHLLLSKADKLSRNQATQTLLKVKKTLKDLPITLTAQLFSSLKKTGVEEAQQQLLEWFT